VATTAPTGAPAPAGQSPVTQPQAAASTILTAPGGFQPGDAAPGLEPATSSGSDTPGWMLPVVLVAVVGAPFVWLARRHRVPSDVEP
jgi:hypothetical protein